MPIPTFFLGLVALLTAWQLSSGINGVVKGQPWRLVQPFGLIVFVTGMLLFGFGPEAFQPPNTSAATWIIVAAIFIVVLSVNFAVLPRLQRRYSQALIRSMLYAIAFFTVGAAMGWLVWVTAETQTARVSELLVPVVLIVVSIGIGANAYWRWTRYER